MGRDLGMLGGQETPTATGCRGSAGGPPTPPPSTRTGAHTCGSRPARRARPSLPRWPALVASRRAALVPPHPGPST